MMNIPSLKHRKPIVYISLVIYVLLSSFIIVESCLPGGISGLQSDIFARISAWFVNKNTNPITPKSIDPISFNEVYDSSYLGQDENGVSNIAVGTTTLVSIPVQYPELDNDYDVYNLQYNLDYKLGNKDHYNVVLSSRNVSNNIYYIDMRVVTNSMGDDLYQIDVNVASKLTYEYKFHIVDLMEPTNYESKISKNTLKIGETTTVLTKLLDESRSDTYLRRYLDESKISRSSLDESIATIDEFGVIHAVSVGSTTIKYGKYEFPITVTSESITKPITNELTLSKDTASKANPSLLDYDEVFNEENESNEYSVLIYSSFLDESLSDQSVSWKLSNNLKAKLAPYKYDEDGYPVYMDDLKRPCVRVCGYREKGEVTITCYSNADNSIYSSMTLDVDEALPTSMEININDNESLLVNSQKVISASFNPKNVNNRAIHIEADLSDVIEITNNNTSSVTITGKSVKKVRLTITSLANPSLKKEINVSFTAKEVINGDNYSDFHQFIRKATGHFLLFFVTSIFGLIFFFTYIDDIKKIWIGLSISLCLGLLIAGLSELIQHFIPSRAFAFKDIGIDFLGYLIGSLLTLGVIYLIRVIRSKKNNKV